MFCTGCGQENPDGTRFCTRCGNKLEVGSPDPAPAPNPAPVQKTVPTPPPAPAYQAAPAYHAAPAYNPAPAPQYPAPDVRVKGTSGWIILMKVFAWILFAACVIAGFVLAFIAFDHGEVGPGLLMILSGFLAGFLSVGGMMIFLNMARDLNQIRNIVIANEARGKYEK